MGNSYRVFGDLRVRGEDHLERHVTGRQATLLGLLLAAHPDGIARSRLIDQIWGTETPADPESALHSIVSRLRGLIGTDLMTTPTGYRIEPGEVDCHQYERAMAEARKTGRLDDYEKAVRLWSGDPYRGLEDVPDIQLEIERLELVSRQGQRERLESMLDDGQASQAANELEALVERDTFDEEALALYMKALYQAGRKPAALRVFRQYEEQLAEETGLEPSARLRELEVAILVDHADGPPPPADPPSSLDLTITYTTLGSGRRVAIGTLGSGSQIIVHPGWMSGLDLIASGHDMRAPFWEALARRHQLILFDRHNTGLSRTDTDDLGFEESVEEFKDVMRAVVSEPVPVWAASGAGPIAIRAVLEEPGLFSHLILYGTYASGPDTFPRAIADSILRLIGASWGMGSDVLTGLLFPDASPERRESWAKNQKKIADASTAVNLLRQMYEADVTEDLPQLDLPCLVMHYGRDRAIPIWGGEQLAQGIPGAKYVPLDGATHYPPRGEEGGVVEIIDKFLSETAD